jgi:hypothetical protein
MDMSASTVPAERTRKSQLSSETSERSDAKQARTVASIRSRARRVGTCFLDSQARTDWASHCGAFGASHGASTGSFLAMAFKREIARAALNNAMGLMRGMSPRYRRTLPPVARMLSPSTNVRKVATPISLVSACIRS